MGKEVLGLCKANADEIYLRELGAHFIRNGFKVKLATITNIAGGNVDYCNGVNLEAVAA